LHPGTPTFGHSSHENEQANQEEANPEGESVPGKSIFGADVKR